MRAKISRVKADQRSIATSLESYYVDNNDYPEQAIPTDTTWPYLRDPMLVYGGDSPRHAVGNPGIAFRLSTPVAYLSSTTAAFTDPFFTQFDLNSTSVVNDTRYYNYSGNYAIGRVYDASQDGTDLLAFELISKKLFERNHWHLRSRGPDNDYERRSNGWADFLEFGGAPGTGTGGTGGIQSIYDPTNGTVSQGDIVRTGAEGIVN